MTGRLLNLLSPPPVAVPRARLTQLQLRLPALGAQATRAAVRLQLLGLLPPGRAFGFVFQRVDADQLSVWSWLLQGEDEASQRQDAAGYPEPLLERPGDGLRLLRREQGFEGQVWLQDHLQHSRWWLNTPDTSSWQQFVRGSGLDPTAHPLPSAELPTPQSGATVWLRGDNLPPINRWRGWQWQLGLLLGLMLLAAAGGWHWQTQRLLGSAKQDLARLQAQRASALEQRTRYMSLRTEFEALAALAPRVSQLALLKEVLDSGILDPRLQPAVAPTPGSLAAAPSALAPRIVNLLGDWDFRNDQLKLTLEVADGELALLDVTRRLERLPSLQQLRIGLDSTNTNLTLHLRLADSSGNATAP